MSQLEPEQLSPELILVGTPEQARLAREQLADPVESVPTAPDTAFEEPSEASWNDFLAEVRSRPMEPSRAERPPAPMAVRGKGRKRVLVAVAVVLAVAAVLGLGWVRDRAQQGTDSSLKETPVPPAPAVTTAPAHKAGFVPARTWSWAAVHRTKAYVVRFLRDGHEVLKLRTAAPRLVLPSDFTFTPGQYRWTVTTVPKGNGAKRVVVNSSFTVPSNG